jgi:hypothetical protein
MDSSRTKLRIHFEYANIRRWRTTYLEGGNGLEEGNDHRYVVVAPTREGLCIAKTRFKRQSELYAQT